jgi:hypothetical protein
MSNTSDPPIIVTGGSVTIEFKSDDFTPSGNGRQSNANKKIKRVEVTGDNIPAYAEDTPNGKVTITIYYGNP